MNVGSLSNRNSSNNFHTPAVPHHKCDFTAHKNPPQRIESGRVRFAIYTFAQTVMVRSCHWVCLRYRPCALRKAFASSKGKVYRNKGSCKFRLALCDSCLCRKVKTRGFLRNIPLSSFSFLCNEEICSISSNLTTALFFRPSAVKVALTSAVPVKLTYQSKVVSDVGVTLYTN